MTGHLANLLQDLKGEPGTVAHTMYPSYKAEAGELFQVQSQPVGSTKAKKKKTNKNKNKNQLNKYINEFLKHRGTISM